MKLALRVERVCERLMTSSLSSMLESSHSSDICVDVAFIAANY